MSFLLSIFISSRTQSSFLLRHYEISWSHLRKIFRKTRQMRSARVANHFLRAPFALTALSPHRRQFASVCAANWFSSIIARVLARSTRSEPLSVGRGRKDVFLLYIISIFFYKIFVIKTASTKSAFIVKTNDYFVPKKYSAVFKDVRKYATKRDRFPISSIATFNCITRSLVA